MRPEWDGGFEDVFLIGGISHEYVVSAVLPVHSAAFESTPPMRPGAGKVAARQNGNSSGLVSGKSR